MPVYLVLRQKGKAEISGGGLGMYLFRSFKFIACGGFQAESHVNVFACATHLGVSAGCQGLPVNVNKEQNGTQAL